MVHCGAVWNRIMHDKPYYLYHLRDATRSGGFGFDGYTGITGRHPSARMREHCHAAAARRHPNRYVQAMFDQPGSSVQMHVARSGTLHEILAAEALLVPRPNHHANIQAGGGPLRGRPRDELSRLALLSGTNERCKRTPGLSQAELVGMAVAVIVVAGVSYMLYRRSRPVRTVTASPVPPEQPGAAQAPPAAATGTMAGPWRMRFGAALTLASNAYPMMATLVLALSRRN